MKKIVFNTDNVLPQLTQVASVVNAKNPLPVLGSIKFNTFENGDNVLLTSSDGELWVQIKAQLIEGDPHTTFCIEAKQILQTLRGLPSMVVTMELDEDKHVCNGKYKNGKFTLPYIDADEYPAVASIDDEHSTFTLCAERLMNAINSTEHSVSNDDLRPQMNGVHFDFRKDSMVAAATDGHKLAKFLDRTITYDGDKEIGFTLATKTSHILSSLLQKVLASQINVQFNERLVSITDSTFRLTSRLIEGRYPNYDSMIPKDNDKIAVVDKEDITNALKRVLPLGSETTKMVVLAIENGTMNVESENVDFSTSASESIPCEYDGNELLNIAFNGGQLLQILSSIQTNKVKMCLKNPSMAAIIAPQEQSENTEYLSLLMPMRITNYD